MYLLMPCITVVLFGESASPSRFAATNSILQSYLHAICFANMNTVMNSTAGPFKELDGSLFPPSYINAYVASLPLTFGIIVPVVALVYMLWQRDTNLALCTLGAYLLEVMAQLVSEAVYVKQGTFAVCIYLCCVYT